MQKAAKKKNGLQLLRIESLAHFERCKALQNKGKKEHPTRKAISPLALDVFVPLYPLQREVATSLPVNFFKRDFTFYFSHHR